MTRLYIPLLLGGWLLLVPSIQAADKDKIAAEARRVLSQSCSRCHHGEGSTAGSFDVLKVETLLVKGEGNDNPYITPGDLDKSELWKNWVGKDKMPYRRSPERDAFRPEHKEAIRQWILAGAPPFRKVESRKTIGLDVILSAIKTDLDKADAKERPYLRYFTLTHLHNNPNVSDDQLRLTRAALSKALNSLSWESEIIVPRALPATADTVLAVNINKLRWTHAQWQAILQAYPYGLQYGSHEDERLRALDDDIQRLIDHKEQLIHVRADWFVATATRPPLYHELLYDNYLPELKKRRPDPANLDNPRGMNALDLEDYLNVRVEDNILAAEPRARRAGFARSGVSGQNRLIERHPLKGSGAYWKSYDFKVSTWEANLQQFPLGPRFERNKFNDLAFVQAGGEIIFNLPNGLQGYLLVNTKGDRIDAGPIEIVKDDLNTSGTPVIVNGLSCMACHKNGMKESPKDQIRDGRGVEGRARERVKQLHPPSAEMDRQIQKDGDLFLRSLDDAIGPFSRDGPDKGVAVKDLIEPIGEVARKYTLEDLDLTTAAAELFIDPAKLKGRIEDSKDLRRLGLGALVQEGGFIKRGAWESVRGTSQMQQAARELGYTPSNVSRSR